MHDCEEGCHSSLLKTAFIIIAAHELTYNILAFPSQRNWILQEGCVSANVRVPVRSCVHKKTRDKNRELSVLLMVLHGL